MVIGAPTMRQTPRAISHLEAIMKPWKTISSEALLDDQWMRLRADVCEVPDGPRLSPYYVIEERDWVHVLALTHDQQIILVRQYRYAVATFCTELPGGVIDDGETPLVAAKRELLEETGHTASDWQPVGTYFANPARQTNRVHIFLARELSLPGEQSLDSSEQIAVSSVTVDEAIALIAKGEFSQGMHIGSLFMCLRAAGL